MWRLFTGLYQQNRTTNELTPVWTQDRCIEQSCWDSSWAFPHTWPLLWTHAASCTLEGGCGTMHSKHDWPLSMIPIVTVPVKIVSVRNMGSSQPRLSFTSSEILQVEICYFCQVSDKAPEFLPNTFRKIQTVVAWIFGQIKPLSSSQIHSRKSKLL